MRLELCFRFGNFCVWVISCRLRLCVGRTLDSFDFFGLLRLLRLLFGTFGLFCALQLRASCQRHSIGKDLQYDMFWWSTTALQCSACRLHSVNSHYSPPASSLTSSISSPSVSVSFCSFSLSSFLHHGTHLEILGQRDTLAKLLAAAFFGVFASLSHDVGCDEAPLNTKTLGLFITCCTVEANYHTDWLHLMHVFKCVAP